jgi:pilus assembly protein Flp/PilA
MRSINQFVSSEEGADLIEYALLAGLISLAAVAALGTVGTSISGLFGKISTKLNGITIP